MARHLFPTDLPSGEFTRFAAEGFAAPVCGLIHRSAFPARNGLPLGGIGTGCVDLESDGTLGYCTLFNSHVPRRGPLNLPLFGLAVRGNEEVITGLETWVLSTRRLIGEVYTGPSGGLSLPRRAEPAADIHYWGHYPVADLEFELDCPVSVGLRAWAPFVPGDAALSNTPGIVLEVHLRNTTDTAKQGMLALSFPGPSVQEVSGHTQFEHVPVTGVLDGVVVTNHQGHEYALGVIHSGEGADPQTYRTAGDLGCDGGYWANLGREAHKHPYPGLPQVLNQPGASVAVDFELPGGEERIVRFVLAWYCPMWQSGGGAPYGGNTYYHKYAERYASALEVATFLAENHAGLLARVLAWQQVVYEEDTLPVWLREALVNNLHLLAEDGFWAQARPPLGQWCRPDDGLFALNECPRGCPQMECIPCSFYGNIPLVYLFPELALSTLRAYKAYQFEDGAAPWIFGGGTAADSTPPCELAMPTRGGDEKPQTTLDGPCYVDMIARLWQRTGDDELLREFHDSMKRNTIFTMNLRPEDGPAGIVSMPSGNNGTDWIEDCALLGIVPHIGGVHLANLRMAERMARAVGDVAFAEQCVEWFRQGTEVLESKTWTGEYYLLYLEEATGQRSEVIMGCQLDGQWMARFHGLEGVFRDDRVKITLETLQRTSTFPFGAAVFRQPQEGEFRPGYWGNAGVHVPSSFILAATHLYHGNREAGLDLAERTARALLIQNRASWDSILLFRGDDASFLWGSDYYQNMMLWCLPAAMAGTDLTGPCEPEGLVGRMLAAAQGGAR
jgi:non-lysosomal glucosylceramidase